MGQKSLKTFEMFICAALVENLVGDLFLFYSFGSFETIKCKYCMKQETAATLMNGLFCSSEARSRPACGGLIVQHYEAGRPVIQAAMLEM